MRVQERLIRSEESSHEDPLDLMMIGHYAPLEKDAEREDLLYQWLRSNDLDTRDGGLEPSIANLTREQGANVQRVVEVERTPVEDFDPLTRSESTSQSQDPSNPSQFRLLSSSESSSRTKSGGGGDDDDDDNNSGGMGDTSSSQRPLSPFMGEADFQHAIQDDDHGAQPPVRSYVRRCGSKKKMIFTEGDDLVDSMVGTSTDVHNSEQGSNYAYIPYGDNVGDFGGYSQQSYS